MNIKNKTSYFTKLLDLLNGYNNKEIESGLIAYCVAQTNSCAEYQVAFTNTEQIKSIFAATQFPVDIETIIEFFEYLVDKDNKSKNGVVFTPKYISDYMVKDLFSGVSEWSKDIKIIDPSCGCGVFLISAIEEVHNRFGVDIVDIIENNIFGIDILSDNIRRCRYVLKIYCLMNGICLREVKDNLVIADSLCFDWKSLFDTESGFDFIVGNPPYVNTHDMSKSTISFLKKSFTTTQTGVFNIFYAFIEHGLKQLTATGFLEFIIPNNFLTIKSAENLRLLLQKGKNVYSILDFTDNMIFKPVRTYNCIIKLSNKPKDTVYYSVIRKTENICETLKSISFNQIKIESLNKNGWILVDEKTLKNIALIESQKYPIKDFIRTGIATLRDGIYFVNSSEGNFYKVVDNVRYPIEAGIVKPIYKIPELKNCSNPKEVVQYIIFPYIKGEKGYELIDENNFSNKYPNAYNYLHKMKPILDGREKGKCKVDIWYAYGRTQGLNKYGKKLIFPTFANHPKFIYIDDENTLFCNGYAVFENDKIPLTIFEKILNSSIMDYYIANTSYSIDGGYYCYQKKYIEKFSIPELSLSEMEWIENHSQSDVDNMLIKKYNLLNTL